MRPLRSFQLFLLSLQENRGILSESPQTQRQSWARPACPPASRARLVRCTLGQTSPGRREPPVIDDSDTYLQPQ